MPDQGSIHGSWAIAGPFREAGGDREKAGKAILINLPVYIIRPKVVGRERTGDKGQKSPLALSESPV